MAPASSDLSLTRAQARAKAHAHAMSLKPAPALSKEARLDLAQAGWPVRTWRALSGGALHHHWQLTLLNGSKVILRTLAERPLTISANLTTEAQTLAALHRQGIKVPRPLGLIALDKHGLGLLISYLSGRPKRRFTWPDGEALASQLACLAARVHATPLPHLKAFNPLPPLLREQSPRLAGLAEQLEASGSLGGAKVSLHGDLRTGNYLVHRRRISGLLDWEFAGLGPREADLAWLSLPPWLYGANGRAGAGLVSLSHFLALYEQAAGVSLSQRALYAWRVAGLLRWGAIARLQDARLGLAPDSVEPLEPLLNQAESWLSRL